MSRPAHDLADVLSRTALRLHGAPPTETVQRIVESALIPLGADAVGVLVLRARGRAETAAATDEAVAHVHALQVELGEGPCLDVGVEVDAGRRIDDTATEVRWPRWCHRAADEGYRSVLSASLVTTDRGYGSLNAYARRPAAFDPGDESVATAFARHAAVALAAATDVHGLRQAVDGRQRIGTAMGILMQRYGLDADRAFEVLRRTSQERNVKLQEVARQVVEQRGALPG
ncbi:MAG: GAF and ANTAR domain-containing protein [Aeromicrobium erythreum]